MFHLRIILPLKEEVRHKFLKNVDYPEAITVYFCELNPDEANDSIISTLCDRGRPCACPDIILI
jgi:hypothetical protein